MNRITIIISLGVLKLNRLMAYRASEFVLRKPFQRKLVLRLPENKVNGEGKTVAMLALVLRCVCRAAHPLT